MVCSHRRLSAPPSGSSARRVADKFPFAFPSRSTEGFTPLDLAKQQRERVAAKSTGGEDDPYADEKKKLEKVIDWLEKGLPA